MGLDKTLGEEVPVEIVELAGVKAKYEDTAAKVLRLPVLKTSYNDGNPVGKDSGDFLVGISMTGMLSSTFSSLVEDPVT